ncbi:ferric reductase-like transmembrane domain-containing protein, partial [bacterium]|nr:ferric reductase-like transmembrane domain-containing protein [bacterium]
MNQDKNGWLRCLKQHLVIGVSAYLLYLCFYYSKAGLPPSHQVNRSWADASIVFLCVSLMIGPLVRITPKFKFLTPWRRDIGLWFAFTSFIHIGVLAQWHLKWNVLKFFLNENGELLKQTAHASNWVGLAALVGIIALSITSNRYSEKFLGSSSWKFVQQAAYS